MATVNKSCNEDHLGPSCEHITLTNHYNITGNTVYGFPPGISKLSAADAITQEKNQTHGAVIR